MNDFLLSDSSSVNIHHITSIVTWDETWERTKHEWKKFKNIGVAHREWTETMLHEFEIESS